MKNSIKFLKPLLKDSSWSAASESYFSSIWVELVDAAGEERTSFPEPGHPRN